MDEEAGRGAVEGWHVSGRDGHGQNVSHPSNLSYSFTFHSIQTIALFLSEPRRKPSLVVAPVVALMQWKHEIETHAEGFTVCLWHGQGRMKAAELKKFDVVRCPSYLATKLISLNIIGTRVIWNARSSVPSSA